MKKLLGLVLTLVLITSLSTLAFAEETPLTLEEQIAQLESEIAGYEADLLNEDLTEEEIAAIQLLLDEAVLLYDSFVEEQEVAYENNLFLEIEDLQAQLEALNATDTSQMTEEELAAFEADKLALETDLQAKEDEYTLLSAPTFEETVSEMTAEIEAIKSEIADLETLLENEELTEEEIAALEAQIAEKTAELDSSQASLDEFINEENAKDTLAIQEEIQTLSDKIAELELLLEDENLTDEEIAALEEEIEALESEIETLEEQIESIEDGENNPNLERFANAEKYGITPGKMNLLEKLNAANEDDIDYEAWSDKSVKEIMFEIKSIRKGTSLEIEEEVEEKVTVEESKGNSSNGKSNASNGKSNGKGKNK